MGDVGGRDLSADGDGGACRVCCAGVDDWPGRLLRPDLPPRSLRSPLAVAWLDIDPRTKVWGEAQRGAEAGPSNEAERAENAHLSGTRATAVPEVRAPAAHTAQRNRHRDHTAGAQ